MNKFLLKGLFFFVAASMVCAQTEVFAQMPQMSALVLTTASITNVVGDVSIYNSGSAEGRKAAVGDKLGAGDKIVTMAGAAASIKTDNDSSVDLLENSNLSIEKLTMDKATGEYENMFGSDAGALQAKVAKLKGKSKFQIKTPTAICGARGTTFILVITATGTRVFVVEGTVSMENPAGATFLVATNMAALANMDGTFRELAGAEKDAIIAAYNAFVAAGGEAKDITEDFSPVQPPPNPERVESSQYK